MFRIILEISFGLTLLGVGITLGRFWEALYGDGTLSRELDAMDKGFGVDDTDG